MARGGISETGLTVGQLLELLTIAKQANGKSPHIDRWIRQSEDNRYIVEVAGAPAARLSLEQYRNIPSHPVLLESAIVDGRNVSPSMFILEVVAAAQRQPEVVAEVQRRKQATTGAFGTEAVEQQEALQQKLRQQAKAEREARTAEVKKRAQEARDARDASLQAQRDARRAKSNQSP
jgi:hypothetical protein